MMAQQPSGAGTPVAVYTDVVDVDPGPGIELMEQAGITVRVLDTADPDEIARGAHDADALLIGYSVVDEALLGRLNRVRLVATQSVGVDTVDLDACRRRGIAVSNVPAAGTEEVAAHAFAMSLAMLRGLPMLDRQVRDGGWDGTVEQLRRPSEVTVGVLGLGRIGRAYIEYIKPVVGGVLGFDPYAEAPPGVAQLDLDDVIRRSDLLSLHLPLTPDTADLIDEARLSLLPPGACIVNVARGGLIDPEALIRHLDSGHINGAALDVLASEPPAHNDSMIRHPRVLVTPHAAYLSASSARDYVLEQARNVVAFAAGDELVSPVG